MNAQNKRIRARLTQQVKKGDHKKKKKKKKKREREREKFMSLLSTITYLCSKCARHRGAKAIVAIQYRLQHVAGTGERKIKRVI